MIVIEIKEPIDYETKVDSSSDLVELAKNGVADAILELAIKWKLRIFEKVGEMVRSKEIQMATAEYLLSHIPESSEANRQLAAIYHYHYNDNEKALKFFMKAVDQGNIHATFLMAGDYRPHPGSKRLVKPDLEISKHYYKKCLELDSDRKDLKSLAAIELSKMLHGEEKIKYIKLGIELQPNPKIKEKIRKAFSSKIGIEF